MTLRCTITLGIGLLLLAGSQRLPAQEKKDPTDPSAPGPEHKVLERLTGTYAAKVKAYFAPGKPPEESTGVMKRKMLMGGRYLQEEYEGKIGPESFSGMGLVGFDKIKKKYVVTWIDSMSTGFMSSEGTYDAGRKILTYVSEDIDPSTGKKMKGRDVLRFDSDDQQTFEMYRQATDDGAKEVKVLEIVYTRKK
ncbi:MAG: DUF1579 domain-containing protein [Gemmataceae bacterium]|nr:DUF1579 domain-containing protein [Gemmataceae bacterium]